MNDQEKYELWVKVAVIAGWEWVAEDEQDPHLCPYLRYTFDDGNMTRYLPYLSRQYRWPNGLGSHPNYLEDMRAAWQVVEKMREQPVGEAGYPYDFWLSAEGNKSVPMYSATFAVLKDGRHGGKEWLSSFEAYESTPALAICKASLRAKGIEVDDA